MPIKIENASKSLGARLVLRNVTLQVREAELLVIMGPSGCGKTTLLRIIGGDLKPDKGRVCYESIERREIGFVLQRLYVFPWLSVRDNVGFGLSYSICNRAEKISRMLELLELSGSSRLLPGELSGGMLQRVAIGRTLILGPKLILMDEPFTGLDYIRRRSLHRVVRRLRDQTGVSVVLVTHDIQDALELGTRIAVMSNQGALKITHDDIQGLNENERAKIANDLIGK